VVRLRDIKDLTDTGPNQLVPLTAELWAHATLLGASRQRKSGGSKRADRGPHNTHVNHMGAFGELLLLDMIRPLDSSGAALAHFQRHLYVADRAAEEGMPDLQFEDAESGREIGIDAKTFDCDKRKRYFAINDGKHRALRGDCDFYFCALARPFGRMAAMAALVPHADVEPAQETFPLDKWFIGNLLSRGSPSRNLFLDTFLTTYFTSPPDLALLRSNPYRRSDIMACIQQQGCLSALQRTIPNLNMKEAVSRVQEWNTKLEEQEAEKRRSDTAKRAEKRAERNAAKRGPTFL
jgi:hypothetical protein